MNRLSVLLALSLTAGLLVVPRAQAGCSLIDASEYPLLPQYCRVRCEYGNERSNPQVAQWAGLFGWQNYLHLHHYCFAMNFENRAIQARNSKDRHFIYGQAERNYDYVIERWPAGFILLPEALVRKGRLLEKMDRDAEALPLYTKAIQLNAKYPPAYAAMSDWHKRHGSKADAVKALKQGLEQVPDSQLLLHRLSKLQ